MDRFLGRYSGYFYAILRIVVGLLFLMHGAQKLLGWPAPATPAGPISGLPYFAGFIELIGGAMIMIGLQAGWAAFIASGTMAVAYFMAHQPGGAWPIQNRGELAAVYAFVFLYIAARGSGPWSVDAAISGNRNPSSDV
jgi:putative oxidoreductase